MNYIEEGLRVIDREIEELQRLRDRIGDAFMKAVELLREALERRGKIVVVGIGKSGNIAHKLCATLNSTGATSVVLEAQNALHGDLGMVVEGDVAVAFSYSGETDEVLAILPHIKRRGLALIAVTGKADSSLAKEAEVVLDVAVEREACPLNLAPTSSTTCMLVLSDALAMVLLAARGFRPEDFAGLHPGGTLGRSLLTRVHDIMRELGEIATGETGDSVSEALDRMTRARSGAIVVIDDAGGLAGIFTHGDFVRAYQSDHAVGNRTLGELMTPSPLSIVADRLAGEALRLLEEHPVDDLPVVDERGRVVGLLDTQDLGRMRIL
jgi:arabinose-5-phosphate isomerase